MNILIAFVIFVSFVSQVHVPVHVQLLCPFLIRLFAQYLFPTGPPTQDSDMPAPRRGCRIDDSTIVQPAGGTSTSPVRTDDDDDLVEANAIANARKMFWVSCAFFVTSTRRARRARYIRCPRRRREPRLQWRRCWRNSWGMSRDLDLGLGWDLDLDLKEKSRSWSRHRLLKCLRCWRWALLLFHRYQS